MKRDERCGRAAHGRRVQSKRRAGRARRGLPIMMCGCLAVLLAAALVRNPLPVFTDRPGSLLAPGEHTGAASLPESSTKPDGDESAWNLILVNQWCPIPAGYEVTLTTLANGESVDERIYPALQALFDEARKDGLSPVVASGYRTAEKQQRLLDEKIEAFRAEGCSPEEAAAKAAVWVASPGTSEHQIGLAVDINADGVHSTGEAVYEWLNQNAFRFGFIRRYPPDKTELTGVTHEPWHYRYVGAEAAADIEAQGLCLEEYLAQTKE